MNRDVTMLTLKCQEQSCLLRVRIGRILSKPPLRIGSFAICPLCGGRAFSMKDDDEDYWEIISDTYGLPVDIMRLIYETWDAKQHPIFRDHVKEMMKVPA